MKARGLLRRQVLQRGLLGRQVLQRGLLVRQVLRVQAVLRLLRLGLWRVMPRFFLRPRA